MPATDHCSSNDPLNLNERVLQFMETFGQHLSHRPTLDVPQDIIDLRVALIQEEVQELIDALEAGDLVEVVDALGDIDYVVHGFSWTIGVDLEAVGREIHRSNMSKLDDQGRPINHPVTGKVQKGPNYSPPDIPGVIFQEDYELVGAL